jgi:8-oxo-dGTP diphosphatase
MNDSRPKVGVGIIVTRTKEGNTQVLLNQRTGALGEHYWAGGGGHVELGESLEAAVLRELREEAGTDLKVTNVRFICALNFTQLSPHHYVGIEFAAEWVSGEAVNCSPTETSDWGWFSLDKLPAPMFPPTQDCITALASGKTFFDSAQTHASAKKLSRP